MPPFISLNIFRLYLWPSVLPDFVFLEDVGNLPHGL